MIDESRKSILSMSSDEARRFLLKPSSYVNIALPAYFDFSGVLEQAEQLLYNNSIENLSNYKTALSKTPNVNYTLLMNKDGKYDWRPLSIIHPIPYVDLVNSITNNWSTLIQRFKQFQADDRIKCISIPVMSTGKKNDQAETILNWWQNLEQASIRYSLKYKYCIRTDITNCYGSIYTHSIAWAIHGKEWSKHNRNAKDGIGNIIDSSIQHLQFGQTNGIPQGSVIFDFVAEMVLGYSDLLLSEKLEKMHENFQIIRYRDDYRIFSNSKEVSEKILRILSDVLSGLNMHFNSKKTGITSDIIGTAIKKDKLFWTVRSSSIFSKENEKTSYHLSLQKHLWQIYDLSCRYPNSGSVKKALTEFLTRISGMDKLPDDSQQLISIVVSIIVHSPGAIPIGAAVLSTLFNQIDDMVVASEVITDIISQIEDIPNIGFIEIWLQRLSLVVDSEREYSDSLCQKVYSDTSIWDSTWLVKPFLEDSIVNHEYISRMKLVIPQDDVDIFFEYPS